MAAGEPGNPHLFLVCGDDDLAVKQRGRAVFNQWSEELGGMDHETIDATAGNSGEALKAIGRLREALQTLPFFGSGKAVWFKDCNFLGDDRTAGTAAVTEAVGELVEEFKRTPWGTVRLVVSAGKVDKRKSFYKTFGKIGSVETFAGLSADDRNWPDQAELIVRKVFRERGKQVDDRAAQEFVESVGPNSRNLESEAEKVALYVGDAARITTADVDAIVTKNRQARAFALGDAVGDRDLSRVLRCLEDELWAIKTDKQKSAIGLLFGLITKVRAMLFLKEMVRRGWVKGGMDYNRFKEALESVPSDALPSDKKFNPLSVNPFVLFKALPQSANYSDSELVGAMKHLLDCNRRLVSSSLDNGLVLQQTMMQIVGRKVSGGVSSRN
jgi:DNA polymerase III subunit delta